MFVLLLSSLAIAQAFEMTPMCTTLFTCHQEMMTSMGRCMTMANTIMPDMQGTTPCERNFWTIVNNIMGERMNMTTMMVDCMNSTDPTTTPAIPTEMMMQCETMMKTFPQNITFSPIVAQMVKRVEAEMQTFLGMFPLNTEFNQCVNDMFTVSKRCCSMINCCNVACKCREQMGVPTVSVILNRMYTQMHDYVLACKKTPIEFANDEATTVVAAETTAVFIGTTATPAAPAATTSA